MFYIKPEPEESKWYNEIYNLNVRGKRGNIVDAYPAVEYDFTWPDVGTFLVGDFIHFQWTGSDAHPRGNAGNGRDMTDRSNFVQMAKPGVNYPLSFFYDESDDALGDDDKSKVYDLDEYATYNGQQYEESMFSDPEVVAKLAFLGQKRETHGCEYENTNQNNFDDHLDNCGLLNAVPAYFDGGLVELTKTGTFHFMSTRNNQFTNRGQKATLHVSFNMKLMLLYLLWIVPVGLALCCLAVFLRRRHAKGAGGSVRPENSKIHAVFSKESIPVKEKQAAALLAGCCGERFDEWWQPVNIL